MIIQATQHTIQEAARIVHNGGLVAFPTETVYGLGANALDARAVARIFEAKHRPVDNPLIVHVASIAAVDRFARAISSVARRLMKNFWPGPLTLVLHKRAIVPDIVTAGLLTVCVRMPRHPVALSLISASGVPIAAPSANISGRPSATSAREVFEDFGDTVDMILDGGKTKIGLESTVLDCTVSPPVVLRQGGITIEALRHVVPSIATNDNRVTLPRSPGMRYRHYAPHVPLIIARGFGEAMVSDVQQFIDCHAAQRIGVLATEEFACRYQHATAVVVLGSRRSFAVCARNLFSALRQFDKLKIDYIITESFPLRGIGRAIMDRLERAAQT